MEVTNAGSLDTVIKLNFTVEGTLTGALWFDFVQIDESNAVTGTFGEKPMSELVSLSETQLPLPAAQEGTSRVRFVLVYGMNEEAGNEYQGGTFTADVAILARQNVNGAQYPEIVTDQAELAQAFTQGGNIVLGADVPTFVEDSHEVIDGVPGFTVSNVITNYTQLDLAGKTISYTEAMQAYYDTYLLMFEVNGGTLEINGDGVVTMEAGNNGGYAFNVLDGGTLIINGGEYYGAVTAIQVQKGTAIINGGFFDVSPTYKSRGDYESNVRYLINCIDANYKNGTAVIEIRGGTFVNYDPSKNTAEGEGTNFVAKGYKVISTEQTNGDIWYTVVPE